MRIIDNDDVDDEQEDDKDYAMMMTIIRILNVTVAAEKVIMMITITVVFLVPSWLGRCFCHQRVFLRGAGRTKSAVSWVATRPILAADKVWAAESDK